MYQMWDSTFTHVPNIECFAFNVFDLVIIGDKAGRSLDDLDPDLVSEFFKAMYLPSLFLSKGSQGNKQETSFGDMEKNQPYQLHSLCLVESFENNFLINIFETVFG
jgi:hypothetical protein